MIFPAEPSNKVSDLFFGILIWEYSQQGLWNYPIKQGKCILIFSDSP